MNGPTLPRQLKGKRNDSFKSVRGQDNLPLFGYSDYLLEKSVIFEQCLSISNNNNKRSCLTQFQIINNLKDKSKTKNINSIIRKYKTSLLTWK